MYSGVTARTLPSILACMEAPFSLGTRASTPAALHFAPVAMHAGPLAHVLAQPDAHPRASAGVSKAFPTSYGSTCKAACAACSAHARYSFRDHLDRRGCSNLSPPRAARLGLVAGFLGKSLRDSVQRTQPQRSTARPTAPEARRGGEAQTGIICAASPRSPAVARQNSVQ